MNGLLSLLGWRFFQLHPGQLLALLLSLCVGCGGFIAIVALNQSTLRQFEQAGQTLNGGATHRLVGDGITMQLWQQLRQEFALPNSSGVLHAKARAFGRTVDLIAADPLSELRLQRDVFSTFGPFDKGSGINQNAIPALLSADLSPWLNKTVQLQLNGIKAQIIGTALAPKNGWSGIAIDLGDWYRLEPNASLTHIDLKLSTAELLRWPSIAVQLKSVSLRTIEKPGRVMGELTKALRTNLLALALLALLVSVVLISLSMRYAYLLRQTDFLRLRMLGVTQRQLLLYLSAEALLLGFIGGILGLALGLTLADQLAAPLGQTLRALYQSTITLESSVPWSLRILSVILAMLAALAGSLWPMLQSMRQSITAQTHRDAATPNHAWRNWRIFAALLLLPLAVIFMRRTDLVAAFAGLFCLTLAMLLPLPSLLEGLLRLLRTSAASSGASIMLTHAIAQRSLPIMAGALCALCLALATPLGLDLMVGSFRATIVNWIDQGVPGDLFISSDAWLQEPDRQSLMRLPGVAEVYTTRHIEAQDARGIFELMAIEGATSRLASMQTLAGEMNADRFREGTDVFISESFARKRSVRVGAAIEIAGAHRTVSAIFRDYRSEHGVVAIAAEVYQPDVTLRRFSNIALKLAAPSQAETALRQWADTRTPSGLRISTRSELRAATLGVFDQTFALTDQLKYLTALIAGLGLFAALMALNIELGSTDQRLRALGMSAGERLRLRLFSAQTLAVLAALFAMPIGVVLAKVLTRVINARAFGWVFELRIDWLAFAKLPALAILAASMALFAAYALKSQRPSDLFGERR